LHTQQGVLGSRLVILEAVNDKMAWPRFRPQPNPVFLAFESAKQSPIAFSGLELPRSAGRSPP
jgi:hypothetical protein